MDVRDYLSNESNVNELNLYVENRFLNNCNNELNNSTKENVPSYLQRQKKLNYYTYWRLSLFWVVSMKVGKISTNYEKHWKI